MVEAAESNTVSIIALSGGPECRLLTICVVSFCHDENYLEHTTMLIKVIIPVFG